MGLTVNTLKKAFVKHATSEDNQFRYRLECTTL